jgi:transcriptional regulator with XRE-family HTH domain
MTKKAAFDYQDDQANKKMIGENIMHLRKKELKMKREELTRAIDCSFYTLENIEHGRTFPKIDMIQKLATVMKQPIYTYVMKEYNLEINYEEKAIISQCSVEEQIQVLMYAEYEKYNILQLYNPDMIQAMCAKSETVNYKTIGYLIRFEREKRGMSIEKLAELLDCTKKSLQNIESANGNISFRLLLLLCNKLQIPIDYFMVGCLQEKSCAVNYLLVDLFRNITKGQQDYYQQLIRLLVYKVKVDKEEKNV